MLEHELGHVLGLSHDADMQFAVMAEILRVRQSAALEPPVPALSAVTRIGALPAITIFSGARAQLTLRPLAHAKIAPHIVRHRLPPLRARRVL